MQLISTCKTLQNVTVLIHSFIDINLVLNVLSEHYIILQLINSDRDSIRKAREGLLITKGKTLEPYGWAA